MQHLTSSMGGYDEYFVNAIILKIIGALTDLDEQLVLTMVGSEIALTPSLDDLVLETHLKTVLKDQKPLFNLTGNRLTPADFTGYEPYFRGKKYRSPRLKLLLDSIKADRKR